MVITEQQRDALSEVLNIATARTAVALSELTGQRVLLEVPRVSVYPLAQLPEQLAHFIADDVATVQQVFSGPVSGDALLLLSHNDAVTLVDLMTDEQLHAKRLNESAREVLAEVGNILLNACLSVFGDLLQVRVTFSVPRLHLQALGEMMRSVSVNHADQQYGLVVHTNFSLHDDSVSGYLVIVLSVASLDLLLDAVERFT